VKAYTAKQVIASLRNLRFAIATDQTGIQTDQTGIQGSDKRGARMALTLAIESWQALIEGEPLTPAPKSDILRASQEKARPASSIAE
jgi:hypothetical protein